MANGVDVKNKGLIEAISELYPDLSIEELNELIEATNEQLWAPNLYPSGGLPFMKGRRFMNAPISPTRHTLGLAGLSDATLARTIDEGRFESGAIKQSGDNLPYFANEAQKTSGFSDLDMRNLLENIASSRGAQSIEVDFPNSMGGYSDVRTYIPPIEGNPFTGSLQEWDDPETLYADESAPTWGNLVPTAVQRGGIYRNPETGAWQKHEQTYPFNLLASVPYPGADVMNENGHTYIDNLIAQQGGVSTEETAAMVDLLEMIKSSLW